MLDKILIVCLMGVPVMVWSLVMSAYGKKYKLKAQAATSFVFGVVSMFEVIFYMVEILLYKKIQDSFMLLVWLVLMSVALWAFMETLRKFMREEKLDYAEKLDIARESRKIVNYLRVNPEAVVSIEYMGSKVYKDELISHLTAIGASVTIETEGGLVEILNIEKVGKNDN